MTASAGTFMASLDLFIVNVAYPDLQRVFHDSTDASLSWILNAYTIVFAALPIPFGRLADAYGRKRGFIAGTLVFALASAWCAATSSVSWLVAARVLQAVGAAALLPTSLSLLLDEFPAARRTAAVTVWAASGALAAAAGVPVGALLVQLSWHWIFLVNLPVAALTVLGATLLLHESRAEHRPGRPDLLGALLLIGGLGLLTLGIVKGNEWSWTSGTTMGVLCAGLLAVAGFLARCARHPQPVLELALFAGRSFSAATAASVVFFAGFGAHVFGNIVFLTRVWHHSVLRAGLEFAPGPVVVTIVALGLTARLINRYGHRAVTMTGAAVFALGAALFVAFVGQTPDYPGAYLPSLLLAGVGIGFVAPALPGAMTAALPPERRATGSAIFAMSRQLGTVLGVATLVALLGVTTSQPVDAFHRAWTFVVAAQIAALLTSLGIKQASRGPVGGVGQTC
nr:MFS transporter [Planosporangium flavigriseum]